MDFKHSISENNENRNVGKLLEKLSVVIFEEGRSLVRNKETDVNDTTGIDAYFKQG